MKKQICSRLCRNAWIPVLVVIGTFVLVSSALADTPSQRGITVMTRNVYVGADPEIFKLLYDVTMGEPPSVIVVDAGAVLAAVKARDFNLRAALLAEEVEQAEPDLIALQEVTLWRSECPSTPAAATFVEADYLKILVDALKARGLDYEVAGVAQGFDQELPALTATGLCDVRMTDRDVILVRNDKSAAVLKLSEVQSGHFTTLCPRAIPFPRGWVSIDLKVKGESLRFIASHLETEDCPDAQLSQALELLEGPANTTLPVIIAGDLNSDGNGGPTATPAYPALITAGFVDAWNAARPNEEGVTCCHAPDLTDPEPFSLQKERIDVILTRGPLDVASVVRLGLDAFTQNGMRASDHAGVAARLTFSTPTHSLEEVPSPRLKMDQH